MFRNLTGYFVYILSLATLGPLLFGFHLVCFKPPKQLLANTYSLS
jgi:uncharacterized membrane protein